MNKPIRTSITFHFDAWKHAKLRAVELGVSLSEYVNQAIEKDLQENDKEEDLKEN